jgi:hypothetical protein
MFNPTELLIDACVDRFQQAYQRTYDQRASDYAGIIGWAGRMALESIANSDALYHNIEHTIMVTLVGQEILRGKLIREGDISPRDWLHFVISLLYHDIGYVRGVCQDDCDSSYATGIDGQTITLPPGTTDASLTPYHVDRSKLFIRERFGGHDIIDAEVIAANIEHTRFPVPGDSDHQSTADYPGLARAADLIGQLADPHRMRKFPALFYEFEELDLNAKMGYSTPADLCDAYPAFYWNVVSSYIQDGLRCLQVTQEGKQWVANLYAHVFVVEHQELSTAHRKG